MIVCGMPEVCGIRLVVAWRRKGGQCGNGCDRRRSSGLSGERIKLLIGRLFHLRRMPLRG